ncbi:MAG TPA: hypothetical protein VNF02_06780 [Candidatus Limnocylindrales bacterium]|nr:hypothetical protein [Candidatus Limnocylindrales bacterium]
MFRTVFSAILSFAFLLGTGVSGAGSKSHNWPLIKPLSWSGDIDLLGPPTLVPIRSTSGVILYRLYCSSYLGPLEPEWLVHGDNYGGDFECLLTDAKPGTYAERATLLNYDPADPTPYHFNLGSFTWEELLGKCWNNPEWGADRTFYLRGMRLHIRVLDAQVEMYYRDTGLGKTHPIIRRVTVNITAQPDKNANTELARPPTQPEPKACMVSGMW